MCKIVLKTVFKSIYFFSYVVIDSDNELLSDRYKLVKSKSLNRWFLVGNKKDVHCAYVSDNESKIIDKIWTDFRIKKFEFEYTR